MRVSALVERASERAIGRRHPRGRHLDVPAVLGAGNVLHRRQVDGRKHRSCERNQREENGDAFHGLGCAFKKL
jgi:hypothetical protein